ncbi:MAG: hypothetical protein M3O30_04525 [Planctomycetota bacterium]|nr:hypothetical protein [Planctomycetota bacterium]
MGLISKLFRRERPNAKEHQPLSDKEAIRQFCLGIATFVKHEPPDVRAVLALQHVLIITACQCLEAVKEHIKFSDQKERNTKYYELASEFFGFLIHLANRRMYLDHGESIGKRWQRELVPKYIEAFISQWCKANFGGPNGPSEKNQQKLQYEEFYEEFKDRLCSELSRNVNAAEMDYAPCQGLLAEDNKIFTGNSLFSKLARNVTEMAGSHNPVAHAMVYFATFEIFLKTGFTEWVNEAARELAAQPIAA